MIAQSTTEQIRRYGGHRFCSGPGFGARSFEALGPGLAPSGVTIGASPNQADLTPLTILGALAWWIRADNVTIGTGVSQATDLSGNGLHFTEGTGANQPTIITELDGQPSMSFNGTAQKLSTAWARVAPGTQPFYIWAVFKQTSWVSGRAIMGDFASGPLGCTIQQAVAGTPNLTQFCGASTNNNTAATIGTYVRGEWLFNNTTGSYQKLGATQQTGGNPGNNASGSGNWQLGCLGNGTGFGACAFAEAFAFLGTPTTLQRSALNLYASIRYPSALI